jgi:hypothetical protein
MLRSVPEMVGIAMIDCKNNIDYQWSTEREALHAVD